MLQSKSFIRFAPSWSDRKFVGFLNEGEVERETEGNANGGNVFTYKDEKNTLLVF